MSGKDAHGFQCEFCDKVLASAQSLNHHRVQHTGQDLFRFYIIFEKIIFLNKKI